MVEFSINFAEGVEPIIANIPTQYFSRKIFIEEKRTAIKEIKKDQTNFTLWYDGSKLNNRKTRAIVN